MAGEQTIVSWNFTNWITIVLMAAVGVALLAVVQKVVISAREKRGGA
jgi:hypothetical protein